MARRLTLLFSLLLIAGLPSQSQDGIPRLSVSYSVDVSNPET